MRPLAPVLRPTLGRPIVPGGGGGAVLRPLFDRVRSELFGAGEAGIYMPSVHESFLRGDLYQDALGTTPVTAVGQPVGLWLDRSQGLVLGPELLENGDFSDGTTGWTPTQSTILVVDGELETTSTFSNWGQAGRSVNLTPGRSYVLSGYVRKGTAGQRASVDIYDGEAQFTAINTSSGEASGAIVFVAKGAGGCVIKLNSWVTAIGQKSYFDNISLREISGNHASQPTAASRPTLQQDANGIYVLRFDGVDDYMVTPSIDFTGTDKMTVLAGVLSTVDTDTHLIAEIGFSPLVTNRFSLFAPRSTDRAVGFQSGGTTVSDAQTGAGVLLPAPFKAVATGVGDIANDVCRLRVNGGVVSNMSTDQGAGTYVASPVAIGGRGYNLSLVGDLYGLIVCGAAKSLAQIEAAERLINRYARAF